MKLQFFILLIFLTIQQRNQPAEPPNKPDSVDDLSALLNSRPPSGDFTRITDSKQSSDDPSRFHSCQGTPTTKQNYRFLESQCWQVALSPRSKTPEPQRTSLNSLNLGKTNPEKKPSSVTPHETDSDWINVAEERRKHLLEFTLQRVKDDASFIPYRLVANAKKSLTTGSANVAATVTGWFGY